MFIVFLVQEKLKNIKHDKKICINTTQSRSATGLLNSLPTIYPEWEIQS